MYRLTIEEAKAALPIADLARDLFPGHAFADREGKPFSCPLPHRHPRGDRRPSANFHKGRLRCFACGLAADQIDLIAEAHGIDRREATRDFLALAADRLGITLDAGPTRSQAKPGPKPPLPEPEPEPLARQIEWPADLHRGSIAELETLARLRRLDAAACCHADALGTLVFGTHRGQAAWILTDAAGRIAEARRLDGQPWPNGRKADTLRGARKDWPLGAFVTHSRPEAFRRIAITEGGPDYLAALHLADNLDAFDLLPVSIMGREISTVHRDALAIFGGRRVRVFPHADPEPGAAEAFAARWATLALDAGAAEATAFSLDGLTRRDGRPVSDLNDAILCRPEGREALAEIFAF